MSKLTFSSFICFQNLDFHQVLAIIIEDQALGESEVSPLMNLHRFIHETAAVFSL